MPDKSPPLPPLEGKKSRSENRKRKAQFRVRLTDQERDALDAAAARAGLDVAAYIRRETIGQIGARARPRRVAGDMAALANLRGGLGYIGNNLNQLTRAVNMGELDRPADLDFVLREVMALLNDVRAAMRPPEAQ